MKQTKLVAVLSAASLLALGASMTSYAAGWEKDDAGIWHYYDKDDELVTDEWKKDGGKWFYLDEEGDMLTNSWVDDEYYVGEDGAMLVNSWMYTYLDEDVDDPDEDGEKWFYFGSKGKKTTSSTKKINGKHYFFDEDGKMQDGWYDNGDGDIYYLGDENNGSRASGWLWLERPDEEDNLSIGCNDDCDDCDEEGWYYFGSNGKMYKDEAKKKINGKYYYFNEHGQMLYEWINGAKISAGSNAQLDGKNSGATIGEMLYTNIVEEGWRADGWYEIDGSEDVGTENDTNWYYFKKGEAEKADWTKDHTGMTDDGDAVVVARIKVDGKYFAFNEKGQMQTGLQYIPAQKAFYYFDENGYQKTGKISAVECEDDDYTFYFETKNSRNGQGVTGEKSGYLYWNGIRLEADDDYRIFKVDGSYYLVDNKGKLQKSTTKDYDVEGLGEDMRFDISKNSYKLTANEAIAQAATLPKIELFDNVIFEDENAELTVGDMKAYEAAQAKQAGTTVTE